MTGPTPRPVVTMDEAQHLRVNGLVVGAIFYRDKPWIQVIQYEAHSADTLRAVADFLDQLEGADLLSGVSER